MITLLITLFGVLIALLVNAHESPSRSYTEGCQKLGAANLSKKIVDIDAE